MRSVVTAEKSAARGRGGGADRYAIRPFRLRLPVKNAGDLEQFGGLEAGAGKRVARQRGCFSDAKSYTRQPVRSVAACGLKMHRSDEFPSVDLLTELFAFDRHKTVTNIPGKEKLRLGF